MFDALDRVVVGLGVFGLRNGVGVVVELEILDGCAVHFGGLTCSDSVAAVDRTEVYSARVVERNIKLNVDLARGFKRNERYGSTPRKRSMLLSKSRPYLFGKPRLTGQRNKTSRLRWPLVPLTTLDDSCRHPTTSSVQTIIRTAASRSTIRPSPSAGL